MRSCDVERGAIHGTPEGCRAPVMSVRVWSPGRTRATYGSTPARLVSDDTMLEAVTRGMVRAGVRPGEVKIVAHANFPHPTPSLLPAMRLGYDVRRLVERAVACIDEQRAGRAGTEVELFPVVSESDVQTT